MADNGNGTPPPGTPMLTLQIPATARFVVILFDANSAEAIGYEEGPNEHNKLLPVQLAAAARVLDEKAGMVFRTLLKPTPSRIVVPAG